MVSDSKSCSSASGLGTLTVNPVPILTANASQPKCSTDTGSIAASASGATEPYTYSLNGGAFQSSGTFDNLSGNSYTITAKDANGCTASTTVTITVPSALIATAAPTQPKCSGDTGSITAGASIVNDVTGGGGFVLPQDRVDVVLTRTDHAHRETTILLQNVRVLAVERTAVCSL